MIKEPAQENSVLDIHPLAQVIWEDVVSSLDQFTNDSSVAKFFMPEQLIEQCRPIAASFTMLHLSPIPPKKDIYRCRLYTLFHFTMSCGIQTYFKERSLTTEKDTALYTIQSDPKKIREIRQQIFRYMIDGVKIYHPLDQVMQLFLKPLLPVKERVKRQNKDIFFDEALFDQFLPISFAFGYLFTREMVIEKQ